MKKLPNAHIFVDGYNYYFDVINNEVNNIEIQRQIFVNTFSDEWNKIDRFRKNNHDCEFYIKEGYENNNDIILSGWGKANKTEASRLIKYLKDKEKQRIKDQENKLKEARELLKAAGEL